MNKDIRNFKTDVNTVTDTSIDSEATTAKVMKSPKNKKKKIIFSVICLVLVLMTTVTGLYIYLKNQNTNDKAFETAIKAELGQLDGKSKKEIEAELNRVIDKGSMHISINLNPTFPSGEEEGLLKIENSPANHYAQDIKIIIDETNEEIYHSGLLLPNYHIETDKLGKDLEKGEYDCTAIFTAYDLESGNTKDDLVEVGTAAAKLRVYVLS